MPFRLAQRARSESGQALVEFSLVLVILFIVVFGIIDFGVAFMDQVNLTDVVREGARAGAVPPGATDTTRTSQAVAQINKTDAGMVGCTLSAPTITYSQTYQGVSDRITVQASCPFSPITPIAPLVNLLGRTLGFPATLTATAIQYIY